MFTVNINIPAEMYSQDCEDVACGEFHIVKLSDKHSRNALENCSSIHVNCGSDRQYESADSFVNAVVLLHTLHHSGKSCRAAQVKKRAEDKVSNKAV